MNSYTSQTASVSRYSDLNRGPRKAALAMTGLIAVFLVILILWMSFSSLDISVQASGSVVPSSRVQQVQSLEGGILRELLVHEGQHVQQGQLLVKLDSLEYDSELGERQQNYWGMLAKSARLKAELKNTFPDFPADLKQLAPNFVERETALWHSRKSARDAQQQSYREKIEQRVQELAEAKSTLATLKRRHEISEAQLEIEKKLYDEDAGSRAEYLSAQSDYAQLKGDIESVRFTISRLEAAVNEARANFRQIETEFLAEAGKDQSETLTTLAALKETLPSKEDKVLRRDLHAPRDGVVNRLLVTTIGGVVKAGESIMEIVPVDDSLLITSRVKPADIAFIKPDQPALIRITAYDSSIFGALDGKVVRVGADTIFDEEKKPYFEVQLKTDKKYIGNPEEHLSINPGMAVTASIKTGKRTVMEYLLKPIVKNFQTALHER